MKIKSIVALLFLISKLMSSQNKIFDSLNNELLYAKHDTTSVNVISEILSLNVPGDSISILYNKKLIKLVYNNLTTKNCDSISKRVFYKALAYWYLDEVNKIIDNKEFDKALTYYDNSITIFTYLKDDDNTWGIVANKGHFYRKINEHEKAINCFFNALKYYESKHNDFGITIANTGIAKVYETQSNYKDAVLFYLKAENYYKQISKPTLQDLSEHVIIYHNIGTCYFHLKDYENATVYFSKSLELSIPNKFNTNLSFVYEKLGLINLNQNKFGEAIALFNKGLDYAKSERAKANLLSSLGQVYYLKHDYKNAELHLLKAKKAIANVTDYTIVENISRDLYLTYKATNQYEKALTENELFIKFKEENNQESAKNSITKRKLQYDYEKRELQFKLKQEKQLSDIKIESERKNFKKNILLLIFISITALLFIGTYFLYRNYRQKQIISEFEKKSLNQKLLLSQMNPHFIFNSVDNIQSLIYNNQSTEAINYLGKFSKLTRQILENSTENHISLSEEITMIDNYLSLQQLLYNNKFNYTIYVDEKIDKDAVLIPPMLTQPFIENAIKHGLKNIEKEGLISILFLMENQLLLFSVSDNGTGLEIKEKNSKHKSLAKKIVTERLKSLSPSKLIEINIENIVKQNAIVGVKTQFEIPYIYDV